VKVTDGERPLEIHQSF